MKKWFLFVLLLTTSAGSLFAGLPLNTIKAGPRPTSSNFGLVMINVPMFKWDRDKAELEKLGGRLIGTSSDIREDGSSKQTRIRAIFVMTKSWKGRLKNAEPREIKRANAQIVIERFAQKKSGSNIEVICLAQSRLEFSTVKTSRDILDMMAFMGGAASDKNGSWFFDLDHYSSAYDPQMKPFLNKPDGYSQWYDVATIKIKTADFLKKNNYVFHAKNVFQGSSKARPFRIPQNVKYAPGARKKEAARFGTEATIKYMRRIFTNKFAMESW